MRHRVFEGFGHHNITEVRLRVSAQQVKAEALDGGQVLGSMDLGPPKHSASCDGKALSLWLDSTEISSPMPVAVGVGGNSMVLYKSMDESLVIRAGNTDLAIFLGVPFYSSNYYWRRYPAAEGP
jgi:hypothetical protein